MNNVVSKLLMVSALSVSFTTAVLAQENDPIDSGKIYIFLNGKMVHMKVSDASHATIMKNFKQIKPGTMIYFSNGKFYMGEDKKMKGGKMLSTMIFGKDPKGDIN